MLCSCKLPGPGQWSGDFEMLGAASLRGLQGCSFFAIEERDRFLGSFDKRKRSQPPQPFQNREGSGTRKSQPANQNGRPGVVKINRGRPTIETTRKGWLSACFRGKHTDSETSTNELTGLLWGERLHKKNLETI
jgi:hypothetical protein